MDSPSISSAPSPSETAAYYHGLPSSPKLLARTSTTAWNKTAEDLWGFHKFLVPVGDHDIVKHWRDGQALPEIIIKTLGSFPWITIDVLRIGSWDSMEPLPSLDTYPVVMLITVETGSTRWDIAHPVASACKACLADFGIMDVEVEIKESSYFNLASTGPEDPSDTDDAMPDNNNNSPRLYSGDPSIFLDTKGNMSLFKELVEPLRHLSDSIGTRFSLDAYPFIAGTKGLYLRVAPNDPKTWSFEPCIAVLTCRHAVFHAKHDTGSIYRWDGQYSSRLFVSQSTGCDDIIAKSRKILDDARLSRNKLEWASFEGAPARRERLVERLEEPAKAVDSDARVAKLVEPILSQTRQQDMSIRVGHVLFSAEFSTASPTSPSSSSSAPPLPEVPSCSTGCWLRDYALIKTFDDVHTREPTNRLPIGCIDLDKNLTKAFSKHLAIDFWLRSIDKEATLSREVVPDSETMSFEDDDQRIVGKWGMEGLTFGTVNHVQSITRRPRINGVIRDAPSWEMCVINPVSQSTSSTVTFGSQPAFSKPRDSGSAVWDVEGRVLGMMTGGLTTKEGAATDTTYVTSLERIIEDLRASGVTATLI